MPGGGSLQLQEDRGQKGQEAGEDTGEDAGGTTKGWQMEMGLWYRRAVEVGIYLLQLA